MARPRKPTQLHVVSGSDKKHPDRMRERADEPTSVTGDLREQRCPAHLVGTPLADLWDEMRGYLHARVSGEQDIVAFEALVRLVQVMRSGEAVAADYARLQAYLGEFGMTPASRSKVSQGKTAEVKKGFAALKVAG